MARGIERYANAIGSQNINGRAADVSAAAAISTRGMPIAAKKLRLLGNDNHAVRPIAALALERLAERFPDLTKDSAAEVVAMGPAATHTARGGKYTRPLDECLADQTSIAAARWLANVLDQECDAGLAAIHDLLGIDALNY